MAEMRVIDGGRGRPNPAAVELLREQLALAEAGKFEQVVVITSSRTGSSVAAVAPNPWELAGVIVLEALPFLQQMIEEDE